MVSPQVSPGPTQFGLAVVPICCSRPLPMGRPPPNKNSYFNQERPEGTVDGATGNGFFLAVCGVRPPTASPFWKGSPHAWRVKGGLPEHTSTQRQRGCPCGACLPAFDSHPPTPFCRFPSSVGATPVSSRRKHSRVSALPSLGNHTSPHTTSMGAQRGRAPRAPASGQWGPSAPRIEATMLW